MRSLARRLERDMPHRPQALPQQPGSDAFAWVRDFIAQSGGAYTSRLAASSLRPATTATLYVSPTGNDTTGNGTSGNPYRTITKAISVMSQATTVYVAAGTYDHNKHFLGATTPIVSYDCEFIATGGRVVCTTSQQTLVWTPNGTYPNVYQATRSSVIDVIDEDASELNADGLGTHLTVRASIADVNANPGSWHTAAGVVYVRTGDSRAPDSNLHALLNVQMCTINGASRVVYIENFDFKGGAVGCVKTTACSRLVLNGCTLRYAQTNGLDADATTDVYCFSTTADENRNDGFNYHTTTRAFESGCTARNNGHALTGNNNGSTMHEAGLVVRVNGTYTGSDGPDVVDIDTSRSWCLGCVSGGGTYGFYTAGEMWIDGCSTSGSTADLFADTGATLHTRQSPYATSGGAGVVSSY